MVGEVSVEKFAEADINELLQVLAKRFAKLQKKASMADNVVTFYPVEEAGQRIRVERKKQGLTLKELSELSGIAYATLNKIEQGNSGVQLESLVNVAQALGMRLWIG